MITGAVNSRQNDACCGGGGGVAATAGLGTARLGAGWTTHDVHAIAAAATMPTRHNGHATSFPSLLDGFDPQRFTGGVPVRPSAPTRRRRIVSGCGSCRD